MLRASVERPSNVPTIHVMPPPPQTGGSWPFLQPGLLQDTLHGLALCSDACPTRDSPTTSPAAVHLHGTHGADRHVTQRKQDIAPVQLGPPRGQCAQQGTEPIAGSSTGKPCLGTWYNPSAVLCHPPTGSTSHTQPGKSHFYIWHGPRGTNRL